MRIFGSARLAAGMLATGLAIVGAGCGEHATQEGRPPAQPRDTWSLQEGDDAMIVTPKGEPTFLNSGETMASLTEGTKVRFLGKSKRKDGYAHVRVIEGPAEGETGDVLRLELKPIPLPSNGERAK